MYSHIQSGGDMAFYYFINRHMIIKMITTNKKISIPTRHTFLN